MSKIEKPVLARLPLLHCRYIDDCCIVTSTQSEMDECFKIMNEQSQYIKLTREVPQNGWLPYLNTQINLLGGAIRMKWYRGATRNILIHAKSAHPTAVKNAVIRNMFKTVAEICTGDEELKESRGVAIEIANSNGYSIPQHRHNCGMRYTNPCQSPKENKIPLCLPFISDVVSAAIKKCIINAQLQDDVLLVNIPNDNIKKQLIRNRIYDTKCISEQCVVCPHGKIGDCAKLGVVYQLTCLDCNAIYIGETGRTLSIRVKEHVAGMKRANLRTPLGKHRAEAHNGSEFQIKCTILANESEISTRKALEAAWIYTKNPSMNNKNECVSMTGDFASFLSLCRR